MKDTFLDEMTTRSVQDQRTGQGVGDAFISGLEGSSGGLIFRGRLPSVILDSAHTKWYEKLTASAGQMLGDVPAMAGGFLV